MSSGITLDEAAGSTILQALRDQDRDRYLACLLTPAEKRADVAVLYAFNAEIARIRDLVREPLPGEIRLQWWRDVMSGDGSGGAGHPLAEALLRVIRDHRLPLDVIVNMIDARIFDLYDDPMENRTALEGYAGETASALIQLSCLVLDPASARGSAEAAGHAGVAQTIAGLLLLLPLHCRRGQCYLPADLLAAVGLDRERFLAGEDTTRIRAAVLAFAGLGREHLAAARRVAETISPANVSAFIPVALADAVFAMAEKAGAGQMSQAGNLPQWRRQWRMWRASRTGRF